jgi:hypothetical protein
MYDDFDPARAIEVVEISSGVSPTRDTGRESDFGLRSFSSMKTSPLFHRILSTFRIWLH